MNPPIAPQRTVLSCLGAWMVFAISTAVADTNTVVSLTGPTNGLFGGAIYRQVAIAVTWTQSSTYSNVAVTALLAGFQTNKMGTAFLTTRLGKGTHRSKHEVARAEYVFPENPSFVLLFEGLTLPPGQYFLTFSSESKSDIGGTIGSFFPQVMAASGVSLGCMYAAGDPRSPSYLRGYPPASQFSEFCEPNTPAVVQFMVETFPMP